jgi:hypothetical protein
MSLLKPQGANADFGSTPDVVRDFHSPEVELLKKSGIIKSGDGIEGHFVDMMGQVGLGPLQILTRLAMIMEGGESDGVKLGAIKLALGLHMHPAFVPKKTAEEKQNPAIVFNISAPENSKTQINMANVLVPGGQKMESWD